MKNTKLRKRLIKNYYTGISWNLRKFRNEKYIYLKGNNMNFKTLFISLLLLFSISIAAQNKKLSIELNYPLDIERKTYIKTKGIISGSIKYLIKETDKSIFELSYSADFLNLKDYYESYLFENSYIFNHLNISWKPKLINSKLYIYTSAGFTFLIDDHKNNFDVDKNGTKYNKGFNGKFGIQYNISQSIFLQTHFHYIKYYRKAEHLVSNSINRNHMKFGVGYRF